MATSDEDQQMDPDAGGGSPHEASSPEAEEPVPGSREDLRGFGEFRRSQGPAPVIVACLVGVVFAAGVLAWVFWS